MVTVEFDHNWESEVIESYGKKGDPNLYHYMEMTVTAEANCFTDPQYGADADGRRGVSADFMEDLQITIQAMVPKPWKYNVQARKMESDGELLMDVTLIVQMLHPELYSEIETEAEEKVMEAWRESDE